MSDGLTLGIDVGTTSVKAGIVDGSGRIIARFSQSYPTDRSGQNVAEQNPDHWVRLISDAMASFAQFQISAIGLTSQVNTHVFVDGNGDALMPAILWQDGRAAGEAKGLDARVSDLQKKAWWGAPMPIDASHACSRMAWVARHRPEIWEKTRWVMLPKDYCLLKLTGAATTDPMSNIGLVDNNLNYIHEVFDLVPGATERKAQLAGMCETIGTVQDGPFAGVPVVCGTMDAWAGLVGTGGAKAGSTVYLSGTSEILGISSQTVIPTPGVIVFPESNGVRLHAAPTQSGGDAKVWFAESNGLSLTQMSDMVAGHDRSAATPMFLPQLQGERAPLWDADLRAAFLGVSRQTTQHDFARAVYEGVAMSARMALETLQLSAGVVNDRVTCGGGGFQSDAWNQIRADVLGVQLQCLAAKEPGVLGAAAMAAIGVGQFTGFAEAHDALIAIDLVFDPSAASHRKFNQLYELYTQAIGVNADLGKRLSKLGTDAD